jgi:hypothetical protein
MSSRLEREEESDFGLIYYFPCIVWRGREKNTIISKFTTRYEPVISRYEPRVKANWQRCSAAYHRVINKRTVEGLLYSKCFANAA